MFLNSQAEFTKQPGYIDTVPLAQRRKSGTGRPGRCTNPTTQSLFLPEE